MKLSALKEFWPTFSPPSEDETRSEIAVCVDKVTIEPTPVPAIEPVTLAPASTPEPTRMPAGGQTQSPKKLNEGRPYEVAQRHANLLLDRLMKSMQGDADRRVVYSLVATEYEAMCHSYGIATRPWNVVGKYFNALTRRKGRPVKAYERWIDHAGRESSDRVYFIPTQAELAAASKLPERA